MAISSINPLKYDEEPNPLCTPSKKSPTVVSTLELFVLACTPSINQVIVLAELLCTRITLYQRLTSDTTPDKRSPPPRKVAN